MNECNDSNTQSAVMKMSGVKSSKSEIVNVCGSGSRLRGSAHSLAMHPKGFDYASRELFKLQMDAPNYEVKSKRIRKQAENYFPDSIQYQYQNNSNSRHKQS